ncbi:hypothetical protein DFH29DRAFT_906115 [Suillus ampliporus]|nr:hypothetical protein DFH29DRAFT_906115 [Suillus ampliporus]
MSVFLLKHPSTCPRVLDATDCPPHNILHDIQKYSLFYDALYYSQYNESVYPTARNFCRWLQLSLVSHCDSLCLVCGPFRQSVAVVFDGSATYVHCSVFKRFKTYQAAARQGTSLPTAASCITSRLKDDPRWFSYLDACYAENLSALSAPVLRKSALRIPNSRDANGSRAYQLILRRMQLLPCAAYTKKALHDSKGKRKAGDELQGQSPTKTSKMPSKSHDLFDMDLGTDEE